MARVIRLQGTILDSRRLPAGRVPGWHGSLDCLEQSKTALAARRASAWMARVRVGHLEDSSQSIDDLPRQQRYTPHKPAVNTSMYARLPHRSPGRGECRLRMERKPALWQTVYSMYILSRPCTVWNSKFLVRALCSRALCSRGAL